jgi:uncharacterized protein
MAGNSRSTCHVRRSTCSVRRSAIASSVFLSLGVVVLVGSGFSRITLVAAADPQLPELTQPVNDFANVIDPQSERQLDQLSRTLKAASSDVLVVATVATIEPYADIREYAVELFENHGRGVGEKGKDNGLLIVLAAKERKVWLEVGYDLEPFITDGFAGETVRDGMLPEFRNGRYGPGLVAGATRLVARIAQGRNVTLTGVEMPRARREGTGIPFWALIAIFIVIMMVRGTLGPPRRGMRRWGGGGWSGWSSGVGGFGGGFGGRGGGFGGGFGGFGGGRSGGGGGGGSW